MTLLGLSNHAVDSGPPAEFDKRSCVDYNACDVYLFSWEEAKGSLRDSNPNLTYRSIEPEDIPGCARLLSETFNTTVGTEALRWSYFENPHGATEGAVALDRGNLIGLVNLMSHRVQAGGHRGFALEATDVAVNPEYRKRGVLVIRELNRFVRERYEQRRDLLFVYGIPNESFFPYTQRFLDFRPVMRVPQLTLLLNPVAPLQRGKPRVMWLYRVAGAYRSPLAHLLTLSTPSKGGLTLTRLQQFDCDCDGLWETVAREFHIVSERTSAYLNWRFINWPGRSYQVLCARLNGKLAGYVVLGFRQEGAVRKGYIADFFASPRDNRTVGCLIRGALRTFARQGVDMVNCWAQPGAPFYGFWRRVGFLPTVPTRHLVARAVGLAASPDEAARLLQPKSWYLTLSDHEIY